MVDLNSLRKKSRTNRSHDPIEIFRRLPKPPGINDLYTSQAEVLQSWYDRRTDRDVVLKLHTGGGKTLVGLLLAQSTLEETGEPVLYLAPNNQLVVQTLQKAAALGIAAVPYQAGGGLPLDDQFVNGRAVMVASYKALFNGMSKFRIRSAGSSQSVGAVILDDAHVAFSEIRDSFTLEVKKDNHTEAYQFLTSLFRASFQDLDKLGTFDDVIAQKEYAVLEVPYWAWHAKIDAVRDQLRSLADGDAFPFHWPLVRDELHLCHALISRDAFSITPIVPLINQFPTFSDAPRRIFMSATIANDGDIIRTFGASQELIEKPLTSRSLAGVSERMVLVPDLMPSSIEPAKVVPSLLEHTANRGFGAVVITPSDRAANEWSDIAKVVKGPTQVEAVVGQMQARTENGPIAFANRYDGMDLPGDSCRILVLSQLPTGTSDYEMFRAAKLAGGVSISRMLAQRIEQGIGRGARGAGDHCVVVLAGADLSGWIAKRANFRLLTIATRAQIEMGIEISKAIADSDDLVEMVNRSLEREPGWVEYHAEELADLVSEASEHKQITDIVAAEREAFDLWADGMHQNAIARIEEAITNAEDIDNQSLGWLCQLAARIADNWGDSLLADKFQAKAYSFNRNLMRPKVRPPYKAVKSPDQQAAEISERLQDFVIRRGIVRAFDDVVALLHDKATSTQFEGALADLGRFMGLYAEQHDVNGEGPDVLWLLPGKTGFVIEAKSQKLPENKFTKKEHGQLLVAGQWFEKHYPGYDCVRVSMHPKNAAMPSACAEKTFALTYQNLARLISDTREFLRQLSESQHSGEALVAECDDLLADSPIRCDKIQPNYLEQFK